MSKKDKNKNQNDENLNEDIIAEESAEDKAAAEAAADEEDAVSEYNDVAAQVADLEEKLEAITNKYTRLNADFINSRRRWEEDKLRIYNNASADMVEKILPVIDSFERSLEAECSDENFRNGLGMISNQLAKFLSDMNVTAIDALGAEFDPNFHNAIQQMDGTDYASNHVCAVFQKGYMLGDKLIRPAMVAVAV